MASRDVAELGDLPQQFADAVTRPEFWREVAGMASGLGLAGTLLIEPRFLRQTPAARTTLLALKVANLRHSLSIQLPPAVAAALPTWKATVLEPAWSSPDDADDGVGVWLLSVLFTPEPNEAIRERDEARAALAAAIRGQDHWRERFEALLSHAQRQIACLRAVAEERCPELRALSDWRELDE